VLPRFLPHQRWFGGKARRIQTASVRDWTEFDGPQSALVLFEVEYGSGPSDLYLVPLAMTFDAVAEVPPHSVLCALRSAAGVGVLHDAAFHEPTRAAFLACIEQGRTLRSQRGIVRGVQTLAFGEARGPLDAPLPAVRGGADQSNTSIVYGERLILKLFRRQQPGMNPDVEITSYLTERVRFPHVAALAGTIEYTPETGEPSTLATLQTHLANQGDGWTWTLEELDRYYQECSLHPAPPDHDRLTSTDPVLASDVPPSPLARERMGLYLDAAATLGRRTADLHLALATPTDDPAFAPEPLSTQDLEKLAADLRSNATLVFEALKSGLSGLPDPVVESAGLVLSRRRLLLESFQSLGARPIDGQRTRVHGDYHLGQVLRVKNDYAILDFEGEPTRSLAERRAKQSPVKDLAGLLRSFSYAAWASLQQFTSRGPDAFARLEPWARLWEHAASAAFLRAYRETAAAGAFLPSDADGLRVLIDAYTLDKTFYEILYELNNRPTWAWIPLRKMLAHQAMTQT
jgi:maltose alpha-D-glucosyltransferase/alpha-amylase